MRESTRRRPAAAPPLSALSDDELFARLRRSPAGGEDESGRYRDELLARLRRDLYTYFRSRAAQSRAAADHAHDLAEDLAQETILRIAADRDTARALFAAGADPSDGAPAGAAPARLDFPRVRRNLLVYAFGAARRVWASHVAGEVRRRARHSEVASDSEAPSPWDRLEQAETEAEWERRMRCGERLRAAEADCAARLATTPPPPRATSAAHELAAELWLWCSHARGSAAAFYAANGVKGRNTTRDLHSAEHFMRACLEGKGLDPGLVGALCDHVRRRARGGEP